MLFRSKFISLYGLDELFESLPNTLVELYIINKDRNRNIKINIPESISKFQNLENLIFDNCVDHVPDSVCQLKNLKFFVLNNNPQLKSIPDCLGNLKNLVMLGLKGSPNVKIPEWLKERGTPFGKADEGNGSIWDLPYQD